MPLIEARSVSKFFGRFRALENVSVQINSNDFVGILGKNGAGKTTLLKIIASLLKPSGGKVLFNGVDMHNDLNAVLRQTGMISHQTYLYGDLTAAENLAFYARLYDVPVDVIFPLLEKVGLQNRANDTVRKFSRGMQQRLSIARMLLHSPRLLLLDEPYTGLDQKASEFLDSILLEYHALGNCILMISHDIDHTARLAGRLIVLSKGRIELDESVGNAETDWKNRIVNQYMA
jgi:heme exporter protein A